MPILCGRSFHCRLMSRLGSVLVASLSYAAPPVQAPTEASTIRVDIHLVLVPVTVTDRRGSFVEGLQSQNFKLYDDSVPQGIVAFSQEDEPVAVGLVLDVSGSMSDQIGTARLAARALVDALDPRDHAFLINFADSPSVKIGPTVQFARIRDRLMDAQARGSTALFDAVGLGLKQLKNSKPRRRALVVISDGIDNHSRHSKTQLINSALEADIQVYTIGIPNIPPGLKPLEANDRRRGMFLLEELSTVTGGRHIEVQGQHQVETAAARVSGILHNQYVLAYQPASCDPSGKWHKIRVRLDQPDLRVWARSGYYSPAR